ncbi:hypothetical protein LPJ79_002713 [Coemansia sp. RSA 1821]|nr:hypothetical protein LPJ79_002713 [Coemansia sp. RSA 1821]
MLGRRGLTQLLCRAGAASQLRRNAVRSAAAALQPPPHSIARAPRSELCWRSYSAKSPYFTGKTAEPSKQPLDVDQPYPEPGPDGFVTISFYSFFELPANMLQALRDKIQREWSADLRLVGRIYLYDHGINAQLSIPKENIRKLREWLEANPSFAGRIGKFNWALEHSRAFRALHVRVRPLVAAGETLDLDVLANEPEYLPPKAWEQALRDQPDALLIDMRNVYEYRVGRFDNAQCPDADTFREEMAVVRSMCSQHSRDAPIYMYCTGGIRCSVAGAFLKADGYTNVKTLQGGVVAYGRYARQAGSSLFKGKNFTFDKRRGEEVTSDVLSKCDQCGEPCDTFANCANNSCNLLFIQCPSCAQKHRGTCGCAECKERAQMSHEQLIQNRLPPRWSHRERVRPELVFKNGAIQTA